MRYHACLTVALALIAGGCGIVDPGGGERDELEENRELWESVRPEAYSVVIERLCFCPTEARGPVRVTVQGTTPLERVYTDSGVAVSSDLGPFFPTIDGLFDVLEDALARDAYELRVTYDSATGIPVDVWIDYDEFTADEEQGFAVTVPISTDPMG